MLPTEQSLIEQMRITELEIEHRKHLFGFTATDETILKQASLAIAAHIDDIVDAFYRQQTSEADIALLIGDSDTLKRLRASQRRYILDLFNGSYDIEYINNRLRIGLVHKRIGVEPKLYLSAVHTLKELIFHTLARLMDEEEYQLSIKALDKLILFDVSLVFDTYIRSMLSEIENAKDKAELYALSMENKVKERTQQLEEMSRTDPLTGLLNVRHIVETATKVLRAAERRTESVTGIYMDIDNFKHFNDSQGHRAGDDVLRAVANALKEATRPEDSCFRYGGDEFFVLLPSCTAKEASDTFLQRFEECLKRDTKGIRLSIGMAETGPRHFMEPAEFIDAADARMYDEKQKHRLMLGAQPEATVGQETELQLISTPSQVHKIR
ncbi:GGDEF domain-containing protein [Shewanella cyperi]|uniref:Diguanylate cyclase DosC n=1 Tax=Shewanella cyperi TaxID=2814292 RepID=A0A975ALD1_9GAMM|nr:GGDEF domain-containing protein [Shewanella cyperi]QSX30123.1 GGDEF domain-containing protein [Shewanella cyperi]